MNRQGARSAGSPEGVFPTSGNSQRRSDYMAIAGEAASGLPEQLRLISLLSEGCAGRQAGTEAGKQAGDLLFEAFRGLGLEVRRESFRFPGYRQLPGSAVIRKRAANGEAQELFRCPAGTFPFAPTGTFSGPLAALPSGPHAAAGSGCLSFQSGSVLLCDCTDTARLPEEGRPVGCGGEAGNGGSRKIAAVICISPEGPSGTGEALFFRSAADRGTAGLVGRLAACSVSRNDGRSIRELMRLYPEQLIAEVETRAQAGTGELEGTNIIAEIGNPDCSADGSCHGPLREIVAAGSHYDTFLGLPGATDNAAGVGVLFGAAAILSRLAAGRGPMRRTIRFIAFDGEELGLLGSSAYVQRHGKTLNEHRMLINLDCTGRIGEKRLRIHGWPELLPTIARLTADLPLLEGRVGSWFSFRSDHLPFWRRGVPAVYGFDGVQPFSGGQHTAEDTVDRVIPDGILTDTIIAAELLFRLAQAEELPWRNRSPAEMEAVFRTFGILEDIRGMGEWESGRQTGQRCSSPGMDSG